MEKTKNKSNNGFCYYALYSLSSNFLPTKCIYLKKYICSKTFCQNLHIKCYVKNTQSQIKPFCMLWCLLLRNSTLFLQVLASSSNRYYSLKSYSAFFLLTVQCEMPCLFKHSFEDRIINLLMGFLMALITKKPKSLQRICFHNTPVKSDGIINSPSNSLLCRQRSHAGKDQGKNMFTANLRC